MDSSKVVFLFTWYCASFQIQEKSESLCKGRYIISHLIFCKFVGLYLFCLSMPCKSKSSTELIWILQSCFIPHSILNKFVGVFFLCKICWFVSQKGGSWVLQTPQPPPPSLHIQKKKRKGKNRNWEDAWVLAPFPPQFLVQQHLRHNKYRG